MQTASKILVVGAGFTGSTIARLLAEEGFLLDVIDKRSHIGGNAYDFKNNYGIRIHKYGPHIFHTSNQRVFNWLSKFTDWIPYKHQVKAMLSDGRLVVMPPNLETIRIVGHENILDTFYRPYTEKMWGLRLEELDPKIIARVPVRDDNNKFYFPNDKFQFMPKNGYTQLIGNILDHNNINISLNEEFNKSYEKSYDYVFNSMPIDEYFNYEFGELPYRSIKFKTLNLPIPKLFPIPTINFTNREKYTRVTEWKNYPNHGHNENFTTITFEEPCDYKDNNYERYYPVKDINGINREIYKKYINLVEKNQTFIGRCGKYVYVDMHQAVSSAFADARSFLKLYKA